MGMNVGGMFDSTVSKYERLKFFLLTVSFCLVIGAYTIAKELKDTIFVSIVGKEYLPQAKILVIFLLIPAALLYSTLVDNMRRYQLLSFYCMLYGLILLVFAYLLGVPSIGLINTDTSPYRYFGWFIYSVLEGFSPFVVGVFWAFANSVSDPKEAKESYALMVSGSKIGGMATAVFAWYMMENLGKMSCFNFSEVFAHQVLLLLVAFLLLLVPVVIYFLMKKVPGRYLHGYEVVYQLEKKNSKSGEANTGVISGLRLLIESPYIFGIFSLVLFYESLNVVLSYQRIHLLKTASTSMAGFTGAMFLQRFWMHFYGLILSFFGVRVLVRKFGERVCLLIVPTLIMFLLIYFMVAQSPSAILHVFIALGSINYSFSSPLREALYIPTMKDMKFKAKSWIDTFGTKFSKGIGGAFVNFSQYALPGTAAFYYVYSIFFTLLLSAWFVTSYLLGNRYKKAVDSSEIINS